MSGRAGTRVWIAGIIVCLCAGVAAFPAVARIIHKERSLYQTILIEKTGSTVCMKFSVRRNQRNQSCIDQRRPEAMVFSYTRMMMAALLLHPSPGRVLIVGLGGGTLPAALAAVYPDALIDVVEIDPAVVDAARQFFGFVDGPRLRVHVSDARTFARRAAHNGATYDLVMLDAFNSDYIPEHLMTREFLLETRALLGDDGVLAANTFTESRLYDHESATYRDVFGPFFNLRLPESSNRVILAARKPLPDILSLQRRAAQLDERLRPFGIDIARYPRHLLSNVDWNSDARVLTDQYSPANLLQAQ